MKRNKFKTGSLIVQYHTSEFSTHIFVGLVIRIYQSVGFRKSLQNNRWVGESQKINENSILLKDILFDCDIDNFRSTPLTQGDVVLVKSRNIWIGRVDDFFIQKISTQERLVTTKRPKKLQYVKIEDLLESIVCSN